MTLHAAPCTCPGSIFAPGHTDIPCPRHGEAGSIDLMAARSEIARLTAENARLRELYESADRPSHRCTICGALHNCEFVAPTRSMGRPGRRPNTKETKR